MYVRPGAIGEFDHQGDQFDIRGRFDVPPSPQRYPVQIQAGDSDGGRELAAQYADVIFSRHSAFGDGQAFYADVKERLARYGRVARRSQDHPGRGCRARRQRGGRHSNGRSEIHRQQVSPQGAIAFLEQVWNRDLSAYDPDGPLPVEDPDVDATISITRGRVRHTRRTRSRWRGSGESWPRRSHSRSES